MRRGSYIPERGDLVWVTLNPTAGHEQSGRRPAVVISPKSYNRKTGVCVLCPATRQSKGYAFEVEVRNADGTAAVILSDHLRHVDWRARKVELIQQVSAGVLAEIIARIEALLIKPDT